MMIVVFSPAQFTLLEKNLQSSLAVKKETILGLKALGILGFWIKDWFE